MTLTPDQTAVLEMLLAGQSYGELGELLGLEADEVAARARAGLIEIGGTDPDRNVALTDFLLGQADPIGRADAIRHLRTDSADHELAATILAGLVAIAPGADLPKLPPGPSGGRFLGGARPRAESDEAPTRSPLSSIPRERGRLYAALAAAAVLVIAIVLAATGVFAGDDAPAGDTPADTAASGSEIPDGEEITRVPLTPQGRSDASGAAIVGLSTGDQAYVDLVIRNLSPAPQGRAYVVWFMFDENTGYPLSPIFPDRGGNFQDRFAIPSAVTGLVAQTSAIEVSLSNARTTLEEIQAAAQAETYQINRPGQTVLRGRIGGGGAAAQAQGGS